ncbi:uncharacterized protein LOC123551241 [Mercenaria mercenaria]|uniref:uncharacterized protein LOC123551241 n=1 Tax=Mercenaria mercenaria TaxID=6596 RepID=UPI00234ECA96|nr:uncharacterized protein LOC123551241 [Mercenaria mercenaria]XP_045195952.2 uncharacterized protein LOC123551241 [Mercenaria mercenaria]
MATNDQNVTIYRHKVTEGNFQNWLKASLVISFVKEGISNCVSRKIDQCHEKILKETYLLGQYDRGQICTECSTENVLPCTTKRMCIFNKVRQCQFHNSIEKKHKTCPKGICNKIKDQIKKLHKCKIPSWSNTRAERWCQHPWEIAKCFMPPNAYLHANSVSETDLNGILSVVINHKEFRDISTECDCEKVRELVNKLRHSPELLLTAEELNVIIDTLCSFLSGSEYLRKDEKAKTAIQKIEKLKSAQLTISASEISTILQDVIVTNSHVCQNVTRSLQQAVETLNKERQQEHETLDQIFTLLEDILEAIRYPADITRTSQSMTEDMYQEIKRKMKKDLLTFTRQHHSTIPLSPLFEENDTALTGYYVFPKIEEVDVQKVMFRGRSNEKRTGITSLRDIFFKNHEKCKNIYVTADAGLGKSVFCKRLAVTWTHSHQPVETTSYFSEQDLQIVRDFEFFFLILLRDTCKSECEIEEMIQNQIIYHLDHSHLYTVDAVEEILSRETCLIVLDGLDEWTHPQEKPSCKAECSDIPHRKSWETSSVLTTTRPWKFSELNLKSSQKDKIVQIQGLDSETANELTLNTISKLNDGESEITPDYVDNFSSEIRDKSIQLFTAVPLVLTYLICLWHGGQSFGRSKCDIYSNLIGLLLFQVEQKREVTELLDQSYQTEMPNSIESNEYCKKYYTFLITLGHLAFKTYFASNRENSFAFEKSLAANVLTDQQLKFSLEAGFLTENKVSGPVLARKTKISFQQQTFQEFFAALYMQSVQDFSSIFGVISAVCNTVESILTMSNVCIFLSGLCPEKASVLSKKLCELATTSEIVKGYRSDMGSWNYFIGYNQAMKDYQSMHVACLEEYHENFEDGKRSIHICLEDYFVDSDYENEKYSTFLKSLLEMNKTLIKSVKIRNVKTKESFHDIIDLLKRNDVNALEKIDIKSEIEEEDLENLIARSTNSLKCFIIKGGRWKDGEWQHSYISLSDKSFEMISNAQRLEELYLRNVKMPHIQIDRLVTNVAHQQSMKHIGIGFIECNDHTDSCSGVTFDLRGHSQLKMLELGAAPLSKVDINTASLEVCYVGPFLIDGALVSVLNNISTAPKLKVFCSGFLKGLDIENLIERMPQIVSAQHVWLTEMDFGESTFEINPNVISVENFLMIKVKMACETFESLMGSLSKVKQSIRIGLFECNVSPEHQFEKAKESIRKSGNFIVLLDGKDDNDRSEFLFRTTGETGK